MRVAEMGTSKTRILDTRWLYLVLILLAGGGLTGCAGTGSGATGPTYVRGPSSGVDSANLTMAEPFDVIVPVFDPGLPSNPDDYKKKGIWPELRRAEARRMALYVRNSINDAGGFGAARVTPDARASADIYVEGKIIESNGEDMRLLITITDSMGKQYYSKTYKHRVKEYWYENLRNKDKDPFEEIYREIARDLKKRLARIRGEKAREIRATTELRFAQSFVPDAFSDMVVQNGNRFQVKQMPDEEDPMIVRVNAVRVRDQMFIDTLQDPYEAFAEKMNASYAVWQKETFSETLARRKLKTKSFLKSLGGAALIGLAIVAAANGGGYQPGALVAGVGGVALLASGWADSQEAKIHRDALNELSKSMDQEIAPNVIEMEDRTVTLTGNAQEQYSQWRNLLAEIYTAESLPAADAAEILPVEDGRKSGPADDGGTGRDREKLI